jgi:hypothetical protein
MLMLSKGGLGLGRGGVSRSLTLWLIPGLCLIVVALTGCGGGDGPERYAASGHVTLDGQPLNDASIVFQPRDEGGVLASALIENGRFQWSGSDGPTAGEFDVRINPEAVEEMEALEIVQQKKMQAIEKTHIPRRYQQTGALRATVTPGGPNEFEFPLSSR